MSCRGQCGHSHDHNHEHDHEELERGDQFSLFRQINTLTTRALNEKTYGSILGVFKPWVERLDTTKFVESDVDEQLLVFVNFTSPVKLKSLMVIGDADSSPNKVKLFVNKTNVDFTNIADIPPVQEFDLQQDLSGRLEFPTRYAKFQNVSSLVLFFPSNFGSPTTKISYIGLKGEYTNYKREAVNTVYELQPQKKDEKVMGDFASSRNIQ